MADDMVDLGVNVSAEMAVAVATIASHTGRTKADLVRDALQCVIDGEISRAHASIKLLDELKHNGIAVGPDPDENRKGTRK